MTRPSRSISGACLCGAVAFEAESDFDNCGACHCSQCRAWSGHFWASVNAPYAKLKILSGEERLKWYRSSKWARRGFCAECGSSLFWHADGLADHKDRIAIGAGALTKPTGARLEDHIFVADKGDYYEIADGLPQKEEY